MDTLENPIMSTKCLMLQRNLRNCLEKYVWKTYRYFFVSPIIHVQGKILESSLGISHG